MKKFIILLSFVIMACGGSSKGSDNNSSTTETSTASTSTADTTSTTTETTATEEVEISNNPIVTTQFFGEGGNLYKPSSDPHGAGQGNMVVLLDASFTEEFDSCEIKLNTGETRQLTCINDQPWTQIPFSCFSNGNRQTWRADFKCGSVAEVKVTCREEKQEVIFTVPEAQRGNICTRFG